MAIEKTMNELGYSVQKHHWYVKTHKKYALVIFLDPKGKKLTYFVQTNGNYFYKKEQLIALNESFEIISKDAELIKKELSKK